MVAQFVRAYPAHRIEDVLRMPYARMLQFLRLSWGQRPQFAEAGAQSQDERRIAQFAEYRKRRGLPPLEE